MKIGKLSENVWNRSVYKELTYRDDKILTGADTGVDCASLLIEDDETIVTTGGRMCGFEDLHGAFPIYEAVNELAVAGAKAFGISITAMLPESYTERKLKLLSRDINAICHEIGVMVTSFEVQTLYRARLPYLIVTGIGKAKKGNIDLHNKNHKKSKQNSESIDIIATKWIGLAGTSYVAEKQREDLIKRFPANYIDGAIKFGRHLSIVDEAASARMSGAKFMMSITKGGIFASLWDMSEILGTGLSIDLKSIPIRQETVELCNHYDLNPYEMYSLGSMLIATSNGDELISELDKKGITATIIGHTTDDNDKLIVNEDEKRFLTKPGPDEILKIANKDVVIE